MNQPAQTSSSYSHTHTPPLQDMAPSPSPFSDDVVFYVGKHRRIYHVNSRTLLRSSAYFRNLLDSAPAAGSLQPSCPPIVIDCDEHIFESLLLLMRYGSLQALPPLPAAEIFRLKQEAHFYGISYSEPRPPKSEMSQSDDASSDLSCSSSSCSSPSGSPKSMMRMSPPPGRPAMGRRTSNGTSYEGIWLACTTQRQLAELPEFPLDLADPSRLVLISCVDQEKASIYRCDCVATSSRHSATQWALNFHHRHAFCTACGRAPNVSPKHFAELFMAAASQYYAQASAGQSAPNCPWRVSSDSTCMLRFISSAGDGPDGCGCSAGVRRAAKEEQPTIWAANSFYSHAFCTCCGEVAKGPVLLTVMLALRYGGSTMSRSSFRVDSHTTRRSPKSH